METGAVKITRALLGVSDKAGLVEFARALVALARQDRVTLRRRAIEHFDAHLSFDRVGAQLCAIYADLIERGR